MKEGTVADSEITFLAFVGNDIKLKEKMQHPQNMMSIQSELLEVVKNLCCHCLTVQSF